MRQNYPVYDIDDEVEVKTGTASSDVPAEPDKPVAVLWLSDPEQISGWREFYVQHKAKDVTKSTMGFRKLGAK